MEVYTYTHVPKGTLEHFIISFTESTQLYFDAAISFSLRCMLTYSPFLNREMVSCEGEGIPPSPLHSRKRVK